MGGSAKDGLVRVLLLFPPKLRTLESRRVELPGRESGMAGTSVTASDCGGKNKQTNKPVMVTPACSAAPAETGFSLGGKSSYSLLLLLFCFFFL